MRGNVVDLAVGIIIGGAFGKIVSSMVDDIIMPPVGKLLSGVDFKDLFIALDGKTYANVKAAKEAGAPYMAYGLFLNNLITFVIVALCVFFLVKAMNTLRKRLENEPPPAPPVPAAPPAPTTQEKLLSEIRDLLKSR